MSIKIDNRIKGFRLGRFVEDYAVPIRIHDYSPRALGTRKGRINAKIRAKRKRQ